MNHSVLCSSILRQPFADDAIEALTELTLDIDNGLTPDICVYPKEKIRPDFSRDVKRMPQMPMLAIEVISASQDIQDVLEKAERLVAAGVAVVWTVEPFKRTIFVTTESGEVIHHEPRVTSKGIAVDFQNIFARGNAG